MESACEVLSCLRQSRGGASGYRAVGGAVEFTVDCDCLALRVGVFGEEVLGRVECRVAGELLLGFRYAILTNRFQVFFLPMYSEHNRHRRRDFQSWHRRDLERCFDFKYFCTDVLRALNDGARSVTFAFDLISHPYDPGTEGPVQWERVYDKFYLLLNPALMHPNSVAQIMQAVGEREEESVA